MKKLIYFGIASLFMSACNQAELAESNQQRDSLMSVVNERDASINDFVAAFNDVEQNLDSVAVRQHLITMSADKPGELKSNQRARINEEILAINSLMDENRKKIAEYSRKLKNSSNKNKALEKTIVLLNNQLIQKDVELAQLNERLTNLNVEVTQLQTNLTALTEQNIAQAQTISETTTALHTAYYVVGKSKELQNLNLIDRQGGLLGMGRTSKIMTDIDNSKFTRIDYTQTTTIAINSDMKIITNHPSDSYTLEKDGKDKNSIGNLMITNPEKFWSASKYLVVVLN